ncbi:MAG TPA: glutathione S-transferase N-terminal domain-containing protein [Selenomonadales bacterium]|nr:glutathione S-transferase N-terminal domain-containing protein [Selenomonadales bacterium]
MEAKLVLFSLKACPGCLAVRDRLADLGLTYVCVNVSKDRNNRPQVLEASGQPLVPVLMDDGEVFASEKDILNHLDQAYGKV